jgi:hypothetical protein
MCAFELFLAKGFAIFLLKNQKNTQIAWDCAEYYRSRAHNFIK